MLLVFGLLVGAVTITYESVTIFNTEISNPLGILVLCPLFGHIIVEILGYPYRYYQDRYVRYLDRMPCVVEMKNGYCVKTETSALYFISTDDIVIKQIGYVNSFDAANYVKFIKGRKRTLDHLQPPNFDSDRNEIIRKLAVVNPELALML
jgi:hypothetical protein